jgi:hypothetical protein
MEEPIHKTALRFDSVFTFSADIHGSPFWTGFTYSTFGLMCPILEWKRTLGLPLTSNNTPLGSPVKWLLSSFR